MTTFTNKIFNTNFFSTLEICLKAEELGCDIALMPTQTSYISKVNHFGKLYFNGVLDSEYKENLDYRSINEFYRITIVLKNVNKEQIPYLNDIGYVCSPFGITIEPNVKEEGIKKMIDYMHGNYQDVVVFRDGMNDISMFKSAPFSIAMGNATNEIKKLASFITKSNDEDGIAYACQHFGWI